MLEQLTREDFIGLEPGSLLLEVGDQPLSLSVLETRPLGAASPRAQPFAVVLAGPQQPLVPQGTYPLVHPRLGRMELFLVPVARDAHRVEYELIFN